MRRHRTHAYRLGLVDLSAPPTDETIAMKTPKHQYVYALLLDSPIDYLGLEIPAVKIGFGTGHRYRCSLKRYGSKSATVLCLLDYDRASEVLEARIHLFLMNIKRCWLGGELFLPCEDTYEELEKWRAILPPREQLPNLESHKHLCEHEENADRNLRREYIEAIVECPDDQAIEKCFIEVIPCTRRFPTSSRRFCRGGEMQEVDILTIEAENRVRQPR